MRLVLRANELVHSARQAHEESVILSAQTLFLRRGISEQMRLLWRVRKGLTRTYDESKREFKQTIKTLDVTNSRLENTMNILRSRIVDSSFRPPGEGKRNLLDFVDEAQVDRMREALKENIQALQVAITLASFHASSTTRHPRRPTMGQVNMIAVHIANHNSCSRPNNLSMEISSGLRPTCVT
jgi:autophagy-related protein 17